MASNNLRGWIEVPASDGLHLSRGYMQSFKLLALKLSSCIGDKGKECQTAFCGLIKHANSRLRYSPYTWVLLSLICAFYNLLLISSSVEKKGEKCPRFFTLEKRFNNLRLGIGAQHYYSFGFPIPALKIGKLGHCEGCISPFRNRFLSNNKSQRF